MSATEETLALLRSIDASLKAIAKATAARFFHSPDEAADDRDLDSEWGDPVVKLRPRDWTGADFKGMRMSECPAEFLEMLAKMFDYFAGKAEASGELYKGKPTAPYKRKDAARARGWAARARRGGQRPVVSPPFEDISEWPEDQAF